MQEAQTYSTCREDVSYPPGMDPVRELIVQKAEEMGETLKSLSEQLPKSHSYLQQFIKRGIPRKLPEDVRHRLAVLLNVDESLLRSAADPGMPILDPGRPTQNARVAGPVQIMATVPAYGHAAGGRDGQFPFNGNRVADLAAPPSLIGVRDAYAVYVAGTSMIPRYNPGEAVFINPRLPVRAGDYVVAQIAGLEGEPPDAYVKQFQSKDARYLRLKQLNPKKELKFPVQRVVSVHRIVMGGDG